ncbi:protein-disulfide reductase DsbD family protein [Haloferula sp. A504]|uniref:protein-disulfide reductase DsbD family protein n=1 Tax=Haloferula sp. A504 TaxID=3373601 RepID=UPI0031C6A94E|nr:thioredoxin family protein [Verrucomicrobiaceae bacterium E54]
MKILPLLLGILLPFQAQSQDDPLELAFGDKSSKTEEWSEASLVSEVTHIAPGNPFTVALVLEHPEDWHSYYKNSGGTEKPPEIEWRLPEGFKAGPIQWPVPEIIEGSLGNQSLTYSGTVRFPVEITPPSDLAVGESYTLTARPSWQICKMVCKDEPHPGAPQEYTIELEAAASPVPNAETAETFAKARAALPKQAPDWEFSATTADGGFTLHVKPAASGGNLPILEGGMHFIPDVPYVEPLTESTNVRLGETEWTIPLKRLTEIPLIEIPIEQGNTLSGILVFDEPLPELGARAVVVPETVVGKPPAPPLPFSKLLPILGGMLLGGLILNLMPCVFPVIGIKIMGFVQQAGEDRRKIVLHGVMFVVGVLVSFWVLSGALFALRASAAPGEEIGWGYQLQNPWIIMVLMLVMFVLGLSMYGLFEIGASATGVGGSLQNKQGVSGSFFSGILATVVATPCSAPFLGVAIGVAVTLPAAQFFLAFTFMALGLALPYLILSIFPKLVDMLPRPGPWMESFKQAMSFLLFATAGFLLWVYVGQIELVNMLTVVIGLTLIAIAAWIYGRWDTPARRSGVRWTARGLTVLFAGIGLYACTPPEPSAIEWEKWSEEKVEQLLEEGTPVYVDFTAQWCATCQLNKSRAYPEEVANLMKERGVVALKADKTKADPEIDAKLEELGRSAIPVNVLYVPGKEPIITPEILSADYLKELFTNEVPE